MSVEQKIIEYVDAMMVSPSAREVKDAMLKKHGISESDTQPALMRLVKNGQLQKVTVDAALGTHGYCVPYQNEPEPGHTDKSLFESNDVELQALVSSMVESFNRRTLLNKKISGYEEKIAVLENLAPLVNEEIREVLLAIADDLVRLNAKF